MTKSLTVIIPAYNSEAMLDVCLRALARSEDQPLEVIVVDDGSTDGSPGVAERFGAKLLRMPQNSGPAAARNLGAQQALGDVLVFIDADVEIHEDALGLIARRFNDDARLDALFGSYDDTPSDPGQVSRFRNLLHCYVHHDAPREANTFWAGCGAVRRSVFQSVGGFDAKYVTCSIEDVELGMRLARRGHRIEIDTSIEVRHLKRWTLGSMVRTDIMRRAVPIAELMWRERTYPKVLGKRQLASALMLAVLMPYLAELSWYTLALGVAGYVALNARFLHFLAQKSGILASFEGLILLAVHHLCGAAGVAIGTLKFIFRRRRGTSLLVAVLALAAVAGWQMLTVHANYRSNWTALFGTNQATALPPELDRGTYRMAGDTGYDGQYYRLVAHDPWLKLGYAKYADVPALRWRRILLPGLAWALAGGVQERIDETYILLVLVFIGLGAYGMSRWLARQGRHPAGGLLFVLLPGTLTCIDRMTVDVALYCLLFFCLLWDDSCKNVWLWICLALCALARDLGFLVIAAFALAELTSSRYRRAAWMMSAALPCAAWYAWLRMVMPATPDFEPEVPGWAFYQAGYGILVRLWHSTGDPVAVHLSLLGALFAVVLAFAFFRWRTASKLQWVGVLFAGLLFAASADRFWMDLNSWPRAFTPLLAALAFAHPGPAQRWLAAPLALVTVRVGMSFWPQMEGIWRAFSPLR
ncbi:MAG TPA: glycosyltransferase family 2 protein [Paludibaculum sp.]|jgi:glycosyltransferase involved in cell wall biosynthesis